MANLRDLRTRIASVSSTRKITSAMKMVAAAKLRKAQTALSDSRYQAASLGRVMFRLIRTIEDLQESERRQGRDFEMPMFLRQPENAMNHLLLVFSASKGLCGGYNSNVIKRTRQVVEYLKKEGKSVQLICFGRRVADSLKRTHKGLILDVYDGLAKDSEPYFEAQLLSMRILDLFKNKAIDSCNVIYTHFKSAISQEVRIEPLVPLLPASILQPFTSGFHLEEFLEENPSIDRKALAGAGIGSMPAPVAPKAAVRGPGLPGFKAPPKMHFGLKEDIVEAPLERSGVFDPLEYDFEPEAPKLLEDILPTALTAVVFRALLASNASENGARMTAMDNATRSAGDIIDSLTILYNRTRQSMITQELTEIISGAEAL